MYLCVQKHMEVLTKDKFTTQDGILTRDFMRLSRNDNILLDGRRLCRGDTARKFIRFVWRRIIPSRRRG